VYFYFLKLAWKNVWRNKRRTLITANAMGVGVMALVGIYNYYDAFHEQVIRNVIRYQNGHLLIQAPQPQGIPTKLVTRAHQYEKWVAKRPEVKAYSSRVVLQGLISSPKGSVNALVTGIEPLREKRVTRFFSNVVQGSFFEAKRYRAKPIVLGKGLSRQLKVEVGSKVVLLTQGMDGSIGNELFEVAGIFLTHSDFDKNGAFVLKKDATALISAPADTIHQLAIVLKSEAQIPQMKYAFSRTFSKKEALMLSWMEIQRPLMAMIDLNKGANRLLMIIILIVAALGIVNSVLMSVLERTREFGVMMAVGTTRSELYRLIICETMMLSLIGVVLGNALGIALTLYFGKMGFDLRWLTQQTIVIQGAIIDTVTFPVVQWRNSLVVTSFILILSLLVSFLPVRHLSRLEPVKALRG